MGDIILLISANNSLLALILGFMTGFSVVILLLLYENYKTSGSRDSFWEFIKKWMKKWIIKSRTSLNAKSVSHQILNI